MRYAMRLVIILLGLLLIPFNQSTDKAVGKIMVDNHAFWTGYYSPETAKTAPENYPETDKLKDIAVEEDGADAMSAAAMKDFIITAAVCVSSIPVTTAGQLVLK